MSGGGGGGYRGGYQGGHRGRGASNQYRDRNRGGGNPDHSNIVRPEDLGEDLGKIDINKENEPSRMQGGGAKRYSAQRRVGGSNNPGSAGQMNRGNNNLPNNNFPSREQKSMSPEVRRNAAARTEHYDDGMINPSMCSGPPRGAPFQSAAPPQQRPAMPRMPVTSTMLPPAAITMARGAMPPVTFMQSAAAHQQILNYQNSPVQFSVPASAGPNVTPLGVTPIPTVPISAAAIQGAPMLAGPGGFSNGPPPPEAVLLAAAAAANAEGFAAVRGGVTYFNPTAQNVLPQRPVSKRPKAAIPIVDPSVVENNVMNPGQSENIEIV